MALRARQVPIFVSGGIDTKTDPRVIPPGSLIEIENMYYQRTGELRLRNGYTALTGITNGTTGTGGLDNLSVTPQGQLWAIGKNVGQSEGLVAVKYLPSYDEWAPPFGRLRGAHYPCTVCTMSGVSASDVQLNADQTDLFDPDMATINGITLTSWIGNSATTTNEIRVLLSSASGVRVGGLIVNTLNGAAGRPPVACASGTTVCVVYADNAGTPSLLLTRWPTTPATQLGNFQTFTLVLNGVSAAQPWIDAKAISGSSNIIAAYRATAGGVSVITFNPSTGAIVSGPTNIAAADATMTLGFLDDSFATGNFYLATAGSTSGVVVRTLNAALAITATDVIDATATANVRNITGHLRASATDYIVLWDIDATPTYNMKIRRGAWTGSALVTNFADTYGLYSRSFQQSDGKYYFIGSYDSAVQSSYSVMEVEFPSTTFATQEPISQAQIMPGYSGGRRTVQNSLSSLAMVGATVYGALARKQKTITAAGSVLSSRSIMRVAMNIVTAFRRPRELGGTLFSPGGIVMRDDGYDTSWAVSPIFLESPSLVSSATGSMTASGAYSYTLVLRRVDSTGRISRSPQSVPVAITLGAGDGRVTLTVQIPRLRPISSSTVGGYIAEIYRSGPAAIGATGYNKVGEQNITPGVGPFTSFTFIDSTSDANANLGETLYTTGGTLENFVTPSCMLMEVNGSRLWIVNAEYPTELWYSKEYKQGFGIGFHPLQTLRLEGDGYGAITALAAMDGRLIAFKSNAIYVITGDGPNDLGQGTFNPPQAVSLNVGTVLPGSVVATPDGIMFQAAAGMFLLTRGLSVIYVGKPVEQYTLAANVVDASRVSGTTQIRFVMANGRCLVWDYGVVGAPQPGVQAPPGMWTTFLLAVGGSTVVACADAPSGWCYALANGTVNQETPGVFTDPGNLAIVPRVGFPHLAMANIAGFQRVQGIEILGEFVGNHTLSAQFEYDYSGGVTETRSKAITAGAYLYGVLTAKQKCTAMKLTLTTSVQAAGSGAFRLTGVNLLVAGKAGQFTLPPASFLT